MSLVMVPTAIAEQWTLTLPSHRLSIPWATWERPRLESMHANVRPGDLLIDVGSEEGEFAALAALWGCDVVLIEPGERVWANARATFDANGLSDRVVLSFVGFAGDEERPAEGAESWSEAAHLGWPPCADGPVVADHGFRVLVERPDVAVTRIDLLQWFLRRPPDVLTIDVEGSELRVLRGAEGVLRSRQPLVYVSVHADAEFVRQKFPGEDGEAVHDFMAGLGYRGHWLAEDHETHVLYWHPDGREPVL